MSHRTYIVVPFERVGTTIGARQALLFAGVAQAKMAARQLAASHPGIAILERELDPESGDNKDTLIAELGAVPPCFPDGTNWTLRLS